MIVNLYQDNDGTPGFSAGDTFFASTITADNAGNPGYYLFENLPEGAYIVQIDESNFASGGALDGYASSSGTAPDPDTVSAQYNQDDNGDPVSGNGVVSLPVTLTLNSEPTDDGDADNNTNLTVDFGFYPLGSIGDYVWIDVNKNGIQDGSEPGFAGVVVRLYDADTNTSIKTELTDVNGAYLFDDLPPGNYFVEFIPRSGYGMIGPDAGDGTNDSDPNATTGRTSTITLARGEDNPNIDAGVMPIVSVGNYVWHDVNDSATQDDGSTSGLNGVVVNIYEDSNNDNTPDDWSTPLSTTVTMDDSNGNPGYYLFKSLPEGKYVIEIDPSNFASGGALYRYASSSGSAPDPDNNNNTDDNGQPVSGHGVASKAITLSSGGEPTNDGDSDNRSNLTVDFGFYQVLSLGDLIWNDKNNNGLQDAGEPGIDGVTVNLYLDANNNNQPDNWNNIISTTTTVNGVYFFDNLAPGNYIVQIPPSNYDNPGDPLYGYFNSTGQGATLNDTDLFQADVDSNTSNTDDNGRLHSTNRGVVSRAVTLTNAAEPTGDGDTAPVIDTNSNRTVDFGFYRPSSLGDRVWYDLDGDGIQDAGEAGIENVTVRLYNEAGTEIATETTDATGFYTFTRLLSGTYNVSFDLPAGFTFTRQNQGANDALDSDADPDTGGAAQTLLFAGEGDPTWDAGMYELVSLGNQVWYDTNNDGLFNGSEVGVENVTVLLWQDDGDGSFNPISDTLMLTQTTNASGRYNFTGLDRGNYFVQLPESNFTSGAVLEGYTNSTGNDPAPDPDDNVNNDDNGTRVTDQGVLSQMITLAPQTEPINDGDTNNDTNLTVDFGFYNLRLGNQVWNDTNNDGLFNGSEVGIANVEVLLYRDSNNNGIPDGAAILSTTTSITGTYLFTGLDSDTYIVEIVPPAEYVSSTGTPGQTSGPYEPAADPDNNTDNDDNGSDNSGTIRSEPITLIAGSEPDNNDATGISTNLTV
ncbi:MAG: hypothetical protein HC837_20050, partial [Chloroflexaceae bacterium]|nr:hypothetical protein [Chloroflexaceae bacterium]